MTLPRYEQVTRQAMIFADEAIQSSWSLENAIRSLEEAWIIAHEDMLRNAKHEVNQRHK